MSSEHEPDDRELDEFLSGRSPLSTAYREASRESAPPALDAPILAAAKDAVKAPAQPGAPRARHRPVWLRPLAFAATFVLSLSLLLSVWREPGLRRQVVPGEEVGVAPPVTSEAEVQPTFVPDALPEPPPAGSSANPRDELAERARPAQEAIAEQKRETSERRQAPVAVPPPEAESRFKFYRQLEKGEAIGNLEDRPAAGSAASPAQPEAATKADRATAAEPAKPEPPPAPASAPIEGDRSGAPAARAAPEAAPKPSAPYVQSSAPSGDDASADLRPALNRDEQRSAEEWVARIRALRDRGDLDGARRELDALRTAYPAFEVPPDLRRLQPD